MDQKLVRKIYQTVTDDSILPGLIKDFELMFGGYSSALLIGNPQQHQLLQTNMDPEITRLYNEHYGHKDLWFQRAVFTDFSGVTSGRLGLGDLSEFDPEYFSEVLEASDCQDCLGTFLFGNQQDMMAVLTIYRSFSADPFQRSDIEQMEFYAPHLRHAFGLRSEFESLSSDIHKLQGALSQINGPVMFLREGATLAWANGQAETELARQSVIKIHAGKLCAVNGHFAAKLNAAIGSVFETRMAATIPVDIDENGAPRLICITPLSDEVGESANGFSVAGKDNAMVMVKLKTPLTVSDQTKAVLRTFYGLTNRQLDVALDLADGLTIAEIAASEQLSVGTVRNHVKVIFEKTGTSRQAELIRLVFAL